VSVVAIDGMFDLDVARGVDVKIVHQDMEESFGHDLR
jgi:hypothetical protein